VLVVIDCFVGCGEGGGGKRKINGKASSATSGSIPVRLFSLSISCKTMHLALEGPQSLIHHTAVDLLNFTRTGLANRYVVVVG
jgi:hypothetical protein